MFIKNEGFMKNLFIFLFLLTPIVFGQANTKEILETQIKLASEGKASKLWKMLPQSWRQKVNTDLKSLLLELPLEKRKDIFELLILSANAMKDKEELLVTAVAGNNGMLGLNEKEAKVLDSPELLLLQLPAGAD